ncbi:hypothetical protein JVT61DRAFT_9026 [Boletus reticuloceps]|uniref:Uncharacterized protein n=1 Tax=Boletus reticuloceps TaxID=495285 RepID=A0A8I3A6A2_9AGAM|nr:hypothetical protein JVT61DRAFT_12408 [Boletus reticuloceps]KAG6371991.1 hypothetical protein JVT61DRAFT_9010 [Boletus reticuloceps]KAG6372004.1 hypothetical protein JVT61DRAFT_9026 [Boletus reticuloceps]
MDHRPEHADIPFHHKENLEDALKIKGVSRTDHVITCHLSQRTYTFPRPYQAFIKLLMQVNNEITDTWSSETEEDRVYWTSLRAYLNVLLQNTLSVLKARRQPMALECWLHREFMLCRHDEAGRREYQQLMENNGMVPYMENIFELDWLTWWATQTENGYYKPSLFRNFEKMLKVDRNIIKEAASRQFPLLTAPSDSQHSGPSGRLEDPTLPSSGSMILGGTRSDTETVFVFKSLSHAPPDLPHMDDGDLDWNSILRDLISLGSSLDMQEPDIPQFLGQFDQVRFLDKNTVNGYPDLWDMLQDLCGDICVTVHDCRADLMKYLEKELSLDEDEAGKDIDTLLSWLQQFTVN